jgi:tripartite-type tricarboxylate transporter receptor subunit TctC
MPQIQAGKVKDLAVSSAQRSPLAPELPTMQKAGVPATSSRPGSRRSCRRRRRSRWSRVSTQRSAREKWAKIVKAAGIEPE